MPSIRSSKALGFLSEPLYPLKEPHPLFFLRQRGSFWVATLSVLAFLVGNMVGQHGWYLFWKSVFGEQDDTLIVYSGTVPPVEYVPDYARWAAYGGGDDTHTYRQVPLDVLIKLPVYDQKAQRATRDASTTASIYSVGHRGSYATGAEDSGSHPGVDIRVPIGTPVVAIANGIVESIRWDAAGYGNVVVVRHPNVPDPFNAAATTLYSVYAHVSTILVSEGAVVQKSEKIALSGNSGFASGPHLHFQIDLATAPWHPYWPFSNREIQEADLTLLDAIDSGFHSERLLTYTVNPMVYVQSNYPPVTLVASAKETETVVGKQEMQKPLSWVERIRSRRNDRIQMRLARRQQRQVANSPAEPVSAPTAAAPSTPVVATHIVAANISDKTAPSPNAVHSVEMQHDGSFSGQGWETVQLTLLNENGSVALNPEFERDFALQTAYGEAEFRPSVLGLLDFDQGRATVQMLPQGKRTIVVQIHPLDVLSQPMVYEP